MIFHYLLDFALFWAGAFLSNKKVGSFEAAAAPERSGLLKKLL